MPLVIVILFVVAIFANNSVSNERYNNKQRYLAGTERMTFFHLEDQIYFLFKYYGKMSDEEACNKSVEYITACGYEPGHIYDKRNNKIRHIKTDCKDAGSGPAHEYFELIGKFPYTECEWYELIKEGPGRLECMVNAIKRTRDDYRGNPLQYVSYLGLGTCEVLNIIKVNEVKYKLRLKHMMTEKIFTVDAADPNVKKEL